MFLLDFGCLSIIEAAVSGPFFPSAQERRISFMCSILSFSKTSRSVSGVYDFYCFMVHALRSSAFIIIIIFIYFPLH